jgi:dihydropteroate synthase
VSGPADPAGAWRRVHALRVGRHVTGADDDGELRWTGPALMGIVNVTPDSFSDGGRWLEPAVAVAAGRRLADEGALLVDVGGESSRPGATPVGRDEELERVLPVVRGLVRSGVRVSIDTTKPDVARAALEAGACLVNDIGGLRDPAMRAVCAEAAAPAVIMHMRGEPRTMQADPRYVDVVEEVGAFLRQAARDARAHGVPAVVVDPGIGFGKRLRHNLALLRALPTFAAGEEPLLVGASRKGLIGELSGAADPAERLPGTLVLHLAAARAGAALLRVHDVAAHLQALRVAAALDTAEPEGADG